MAKGQSLQDPFLNALRRERVPVSIYLVNGIKLQGQIESFDQFVILLKNTVSQMVYKHAISTVVLLALFLTIVAVLLAVRVMVTTTLVLQLNRMAKLLSNTSCALKFKENMGRETLPVFSFVFLVIKPKRL